MPPGASYWTPLGRAERGRAGGFAVCPSAIEEREPPSVIVFRLFRTVLYYYIKGRIKRGTLQVGKAGKREVEHLSGYLEGPYRRCSELVESGSSWRELKAACACEMLMMTSYVDSGMAVCTPFVHTKL
uniref:Uncharacterized protein n=1 Tax=Coccidioides posadasii RMSCC 3488 TaxID=454284 RepID=A0A0J6I630_COCPO|nr:hypothetical protein CPAG_03199 [Coccidioides posadasii RMSCC 3488]